MIRHKIDEAEAALSNFNNIRGQCTNIKTGRKSIEAELDNIEAEIEDQLDAITEELRAASDGSTADGRQTTTGTISSVAWSLYR